MADPMIDENGVPWCQDSCPSHDGKRCTETGFRPARICEPAVIALRAALAKAEAQLSFLSMAVSILPCGHTRENLVKGNQTRTDEGDCAICETLKALERAEARAEKAEARLHEAACRVYGYDHTFGPDAADQMAPHIIALRARAERVEAEIASAHQALTRAGVEEQIPPLKTALAPLVGRILRLGYRAEKAEAELAALRDQTRVRDVCREQPKLGEKVLVYAGPWTQDKYTGSVNAPFVETAARFWLPMPPKPEETR